MANPYDASRLANFGRDAARAYATLVRTEERLALEINEALESGISPIKLAHDLLGRCPDREAMLHLITVLDAMAKLERIPKSLTKPFEKGIRPNRV